MLSLREEQHRLGELKDAVAALVENLPNVPGWRLVLAYVEAVSGDHDAAREDLAAVDLAALPEDVYLAAELAFTSKLLDLLGGEHERARLLYERTLPMAGRCLVVVAIAWGSSDRYLGLLAAQAGLWEDAERHFEAAIEFNARIRAWPMLAHTRHDYARMLIARGAGASDRAPTLLGEALEAAERYEMPWLIGRIDEVRSQAVVR